MQNMRLLFVADGRSPIAINWIRHFVDCGNRVHLVSTFACKPELALDGLDILPVAFSSLKKPSRPSAPRSGSGSAPGLGLRTTLRQWLGPLTIRRAATVLRQIIQRVEPELVHALRIPYEGMLAAEAYTGIPLAVSVWGNDFTLHGPSTALMRHYTEWTVKAADALHADCQRDIRLSRQWGFASDRPTLVIPGNGGLHRDVFHPPEMPVREPVILNPRGFRAYVRNDVFFRAIPLVLARRPEARFICSAMANEPQAMQWIKELDIGPAVELHPVVPHEQMAQVFRRAQVVVSPSIHDGTPNSLLEGMACGCFPVAGELESIREWITPGKNGLLFDSGDAGSIAEAILSALENEDLRHEAAGHNQKMLASRADYETCMKQAEAFYERIVSR
jgi:hypothetical protein